MTIYKKLVILIILCFKNLNEKLIYNISIHFSVYNIGMVLVMEERM